MGINRNKRLTIALADGVAPARGTTRFTCDIFAESAGVSLVASAR